MKSKTISLLLAGMIGGCDYDPAKEPVQRDVYTKLEDCMADWDDKELCLEAAKLSDQEKEQYASRGSHGSVIMYPHYFYGPQYVPGSRVTYYNGREYSARSNNAVQSTPRTPPSSNFVNSRTAAGGTARGGFGSAGRSAGSAGIS